MDGVRIVFHAAAKVLADRSAASFHATNVTGAVNVAQAAARAGVQRMVHISSTSVYGNRTGTVSETTPLLETGAHYADSKLQAEKELASLAPRAGLRFTILRPALIYGPGDTYLPMVCNNLLRKRMRVIGSGKNPAPIVFCRDVAECALAAAICPAAQGETFNVASDERVSWAEFLAALAAEIGASVPRVHIPASAALLFARFTETAWWVARRPGKPPATIEGVRLFLSNCTYHTGKLQRVVGFQPRVRYRDGLKQFVAWMQGIQMKASSGGQCQSISG
jgi:nucleoside-diphosphate-sugar epimerase